MADGDDGFDALLAYLRDQRGFDFSGYKRPSLERRVARRLGHLGVDGYPAYVEHLELHPDEFTTLFNTVLINVTSFFRDLPAWEYVAGEVVPELLRAKGPSAPVRVWSAGCASGEEPFTAAMVLARELGLDEYRERVKVYATDVDEEALATARAGVYTGRDVDAVPESYRQFFEGGGERWTVHRDLRRSMIFGRHDLIQDAPISRIDLLLCRNVLIYVNAETQAAVLNRLSFSLTDVGYLFAGKAEMLLTHSSLFVPVDLRRRVFTKAPAPAGRSLYGRHARQDPPGDGATLQRLAFTASPVAQVVLDSEGRVTLLNERATAHLGVDPRDIGRPFQDLELSYRPVDLRTALEQVRAEGRPVRLKEVEWVRAGVERMFLDIELIPLHHAPDAPPSGVALAFTDVSRYRELHSELEHANVELETAYEELQSTNEELETTNEELQSTIEELETTNEELQSTNEELETMNEELHSTNDELQSINELLRDRTAQLDQANAFLHAIVASVRDVVAVVDDDLRVRLWSARATDLWGLRPDEVTGLPLATLDIGLPVAEVVAPIRRLVSDGADADAVDVVGHDRRGRAVNFRVRMSRLRAPGPHGFNGAVVFAEARE